ncbi:MAG: hypothetical protein AMS20_00110 [Gemmatimonas sp. SG8_28]|nr:MAG: hypothetical protein AMS20_00110 [Gemmatimonas sp. SG8_28]
MKTVRKHMEIVKERQRIADSIACIGPGNTFTSTRIADLMGLTLAAHRAFVSRTCQRMADDGILSIVGGNGKLQTKHYRIASMSALLALLQEGIDQDHRPPSREQLSEEDQADLALKDLPIIPTEEAEPGRWNILRPGPVRHLEGAAKTAERLSILEEQVGHHERAIERLYRYARRRP